MRVYHKILLRGSIAFRTILLHFAQPVPGPILIHCTAGKDRTGVAVMLLMLLVGCSPSAVADEYALTEQGLAEWRPPVVQRLLANPALKDNEEGVNNMVSARRENMLAVIKLLEREYGGVEGYMEKEMGLAGEIVARIKEGLVLG
jgi:protein tyrosine/serine phosphatase